MGAGGTVSCSIATAGIGSALFTLVVAVTPTVAAGTVVANTATVSSATADPDSGQQLGNGDGDGYDNDHRDGGPLDHGYRAGNGIPGMLIEYTLTVVNAGPSSAAAVTVDDRPPSGLTVPPPRFLCFTVFPCALGTLAPGESRSVRAFFRVPPGYAGANPIVNVATVFASTLDPVLANNSASASTLVTDTAQGCDVNGDGRPEFMTGAGPGGGPHVRIWSVDSGNLTELASPGFYAYDSAFAGGVQVACRDLTGDGVAELVTGDGPGGSSHVRVWSVTGGGLSELTGFFAYGPAFRAA